MSEDQKPRLMSETSEGVSEGVSPLMGPTGFDLGEWVAGREQATRFVRIFGALHLFGEREELGEDLTVARARGDKDEVRRLQERIAELTVAMQDDVLDFKLQGLTQSRRREVVEAAAEFDPDDGVGAMMFMVSEYVVEPEGVTPEQLLGLAEWDPVQAGELAKAMSQLNTHVPNVEASRPF